MSFILTKYVIFVNKNTETYNKSMKLLLKEQIKILLVQEGLKLKDLALLIEQKTGKKCSPDSLSHKLNRGTMTYNEVINIAEILGYNVNFDKD